MSQNRLHRKRFRNSSPQKSIICDGVESIHTSLRFLETTGALARRHTTFVWFCSALLLGGDRDRVRRVSGRLSHRTCKLVATDKREDRPLMIPGTSM